MEYTKLKSINQYKSKSINPAKTPETVFEMYSVPIYETGHPEYLRGDEIASSKVVVQKNDILLCKINPRINRVWVVSDESDKINIASSEWIVIRNNEYNPEFLAWYFRSRKFQKLMTSEVTGIGGSLTRAQPKRVAEYPVPILDRLKQDEIVDILNRCKFVMDSRKQELSELDTLIKARFVEMFGDPIYNDKNWETDTVEQLCNSKDMKSDILTDSKIKINKLGVDNSSARMVPVNSVIMVIRSGILKHTLPVAINEVPITVNQDLKVFIPGEKVLSKFLAFQFKMHEKDILSKVRAVTADNIEFNSLKQRKMILPPIELQNEFADFVQQIDKLRVVIQKSLDEAQYLFDSLMQEYFG